MRVYHAPILSGLTTLKVGGRAMALVVAEDRADLARLPETLHPFCNQGARIECIGYGSNLLAHEGELRVVLLQTAIKDEPSVVKAERADVPDGDVLVRVGAGVGLPKLLAFCARHGFRGLEGLAGIPGNVGGAVAMNAGSYGCQMGQVLYEIEVFLPKTGLCVFTKERFSTAYRQLLLEHDEPWQLIVSATLALQKRHEDSTMATQLIQESMRKNMEQKRATQPLGVASAGCVFKNPSGVSAGLLLDQAGCKGWEEGGMALSCLHANFLINKGGGTAHEALTLLERAQEAVAKIHGIALEYEVRQIPC